MRLSCGQPLVCIGHYNYNCYLYIRESRIVYHVAIITSAIVLSSVTIVYIAIEAVGYWIWIAEIQVTIQDFVKGFIHTRREVLLHL